MFPQIKQIPGEKIRHKNNDEARPLYLSLGLILATITGFARAESYEFDMWLSDLNATKLESGAAFAGMTALGLRSWNWGSSNTFKVNAEGWFGTDTGSGGIDKLGHGFTSYAITNVIANRLLREGRSPQRAGLSAALTAQAIMLYVETFDGFSKDHGFSKEDLAFNAMGSALAYGRTVYPGLSETLDFRMEYLPSGYKGFRPFSDYAGQKFLFALKLGGFRAFSASPLRYVELQAGYYARGFSKPEADDGIGKSRSGFVGVGLNLNELFLGPDKKNDSNLINGGRLFFEHIQLPHTATRTPLP